MNTKTLLIVWLLLTPSLQKDGAPAVYATEGGCSQAAAVVHVATGLRTVCVRVFAGP